MTPASLHQARETKRWLRNLSADCRLAIKLLDVEMSTPPGPDRGKRIARITNALQLSVDMAERFGLGKGCKK